MQDLEPLANAQDALDIASRGLNIDFQRLSASF
jgi:hypothetical protein